MQSLLCDVAIAQWTTGAISLGVAFQGVAAGVPCHIRGLHPAPHRHRSKQQVFDTVCRPGGVLLSECSASEYAVHPYLVLLCARVGSRRPCALSSPLFWPATCSCAKRAAGALPHYLRTGLYLEQCIGSASNAQLLHCVQCEASNRNPPGKRHAGANTISKACYHSPC